MFLLWLLSLQSCSQMPKHVKVGHIEIKSNFNEAFFSDTVFVSLPASIAVYSNDTLERFEKYSLDTLSKKEFFNALIIDQNKKSFGFKKCDANLKNDTVVIRFYSIIDESLVVKIFKNNYIVEYSDRTSKRDTVWHVCSQNLSLSPNFRAAHQKVFGKIKVSLAPSENCSDSSMIVLDGLFYFSRL
jgi:hypothetical protein